MTNAFTCIFENTNTVIRSKEIENRRCSVVTVVIA